MKNAEVVQAYFKEGVTVDAEDYTDGSGSFIPEANMDDYTSARQSCADNLLSHLGTKLSESDFPASFDREDRRKILSGFNEKQSEYIARKAMFLEVTPGNIYWKEASRDLSYSLSDSSDKEAARPEPVLNHCATIIARRNRNNLDLRGDSKSTDALASVLLSPDVELDMKSRCNLAAHLITHSRIQNRSRERFKELRKTLPTEATSICRKIVYAGVQPEVMNHYDALRKADDSTLMREMHLSQGDVLEAAREGVVTRSSRAPVLPRDERCRIQGEIKSMGKLVSRAQDSGLYSDAMSNANRKLFSLSKFSGGSEAAMIAPEAIRLQRNQEMTKGKVISAREDAVEY